MCFSAAASFTGGAILTGMGILTLRQVKTKHSIPFASIPLIFGIQQIIEGMVWLTFFDSSILHQIFVFMFVFIAYVFWPIFVPITIALLEKNTIRKRMLWVVSGIGAVIGIYLFIHILIGPVTADIISNSICYDVPVPYPFLSFSLYFIAACGGSMLSSSRKIHIFGTAMLFSFFIAHLFYPKTFFSVWCFFSALLSLIIYVHMKDLKKLAEIIKNNPVIDIKIEK